MRLIINLILVALVGVLIYVLYSSINEPIEFQAEKNRREGAVIDRLTDIRKTQELYREVHGEYAKDFDSLISTIQDGKIPVVKVVGDPDDPSNTDAIRYDTSYVPAIDYFTDYEKGTKRTINLDSLRYVPFTSGQQFNVQADTLTYQSTLVNVVEVGVTRTQFMGPYADVRFKRYDANYDPSKIIKFGNMNSPNLAGNWER
jgi:hypothetical protein